MVVLSLCLTIGCIKWSLRVEAIMALVNKKIPVPIFGDTPLSLGDREGNKIRGDTIMK